MEFHLTQSRLRGIYKLAVIGLVIMLGVGQENFVGLFVSDYFSFALE